MWYSDLIKAYRTQENVPYIISGSIFSNHAKRFFPFSDRQNKVNTDLIYNLIYISIYLYSDWAN